jgi:hypothetical protein
MRKSSKSSRRSRSKRAGKAASKRLRATSTPEAKSYRTLGSTRASKEAVVQEATNSPEVRNRE